MWPLKGDRQTNDVSRYWDALVRGAPADEVAQLRERVDPTVIAAIERIRATYRPRRADPAFIARLERDLMHAIVFPGVDSAPHGRDSTATTRRQRSPIGTFGGAVTPRAQPRWASISAFVVTLLLVGLAGAYLVHGPLRHERNHRQTVPAASAPATPTVQPGVLADETVLTLTIPADGLPHGDDVQTGLAHYTIPPGTRSTWSTTCCNGPMAEYVISGAYTVRFNAPIHVYRADGAVEEVAAATEVTLGPGDALLSRQETPFEAANTGAAPVELLDWGLVDNGTSAGPHQLAWWALHGSDLQPGTILAPATVDLRLRRLTLAPDIKLPTTGPVAELVVATDPNGSLSRSSDGTVRNFGADPITIYVLTLDQPTGSPVGGTPAP